MWKLRSISEHSKGVWFPARAASPNSAHKLVLERWSPEPQYMTILVVGNDVYRYSSRSKMMLLYRWFD